MHSQFRSYQLAVTFARDASRLSCPSHLKSQLLRASSSVALNLSEGVARPSETDRRRYYVIAFGSLRESQTILELVATCPVALIQQADVLAANLYRLCYPKK